MFKTDRPQYYEEVYQGLLARLRDLNFRWLAPGLGADYDQGTLLIASFGKRYRITPEGIRDEDGAEPPLTVRIVLSYYILHGGSAELAGEWVSYRDFKDAAFFMASYRETVERAIAAEFSGRLETLRTCSQRIGGQELPELGSGDVCHRYQALPNVPLALVFYDADEELPASATVLYDRHSTFFLDLECLAVLGLILKERLLEVRDQLVR